MMEVKSTSQRDRILSPKVIKTYLVPKNVLRQYIENRPLQLLLNVNR